MQTLLSLPEDRGDCGFDDQDGGEDDDEEEEEWDGLVDWVVGYIVQVF